MFGSFAGDSDHNEFRLTGDWRMRLAIIFTFAKNLCSLVVVACAFWRTSVVLRGKSSVKLGGNWEFQG